MSLPPYYVLFSHSSIAAPNAGTPSKTLGHPAIQYHYANDSPLALWPQHPDEYVLVLDYDPASTQPPVIQSMSKHLAVVSLKVEEAPGAAAANENDLKNDRMYIIETTTSDDSSDVLSGDRKSAHNVLMQFKRRNAILRRALAYPNTSSSDPLPSHPMSPLRPDS